MGSKLLLTSGRYLRTISTRGVSGQANTWDVLTAVCVERLPIVSAPLTDIQARYQQLLNTIEVEKSYKSDHEIKREQDKKQAELLKNESVDIDIDAVNKLTAQDFEDASTDEIAKFKFADILTDADKKNDKKSLNRGLQSHLVLVTEHKIGNDKKWVLPQGLRQEEETLRQTAERVLSQQCGSTLQVQLLSNAPCGFYKYKYPTSVNGAIGAKIFFYYARYLTGNIDEKENKTPFQWLTRNELNSTLPDRYQSSIKDFLIEERA